VSHVPLGARMILKPTHKAKRRRTGGQAARRVGYRQQPDLLMQGVALEGLPNVSPKSHYVRTPPW
jgi:hypothetical protein